MRSDAVVGRVFCVFTPTRKIMTSFFFLVFRVCLTLFSLSLVVCLSVARVSASTLPFTIIEKPERRENGERMRMRREKYPCGGVDVCDFEEVLCAVHVLTDDGKVKTSPGGCSWDAWDAHVVVCVCGLLCCVFWVSFLL